MLGLNAERDRIDVQLGAAAKLPLRSLDYELARRLSANLDRRRSVVGSGLQKYWNGVRVVGGDAGL